MKDWSKYEYKDMLIIKFGPLWVLRRWGIISWGEHYRLCDEIHRRLRDD